MRAILFRHLIRVNYKLYMALDWILQISDVLIHPDVIGNNIICTIKKALTTLAKPGTYVEQATL